MKNTKLLLAIMLFICSSAAFATDYYFCDTGNDDNPGTQAKPMKSFTKAVDIFNKLPAGGSVNLCRGGVFESSIQQRIASWKCSAEHVCRFGDYGDLAKDNPIIIANGITPFNFQDGGPADSDGGYLVENLTLLGKNDAPAGIMLFNDVNDFDANNLHIESFGIGFYSAGANGPNANADQSNDRIIFRNSVVMNNRLIGWHGGCNDCVIENNVFEKNGSKPVRDHNIYIDSPIKSNDFYNRNIKILNNKLINSTQVDGVCTGVSLVAHGIIRDLLIDGNEIIETKGKVNDNCWGIGIDPGNQLDESFIGVTITNNMLVNVGNMGIGCASCSDVLIENNTIIDEGNVLRTGIAVPNKVEDTHKSSNVTILNNKIAMSNAWSQGVSLGGDNIFVAEKNVISIADYTKNAKCFHLAYANIDTDVSRNTCSNHSSVSLKDLTSQYPTDADTAEPIIESNTEVEIVVPEKIDKAIENTTKGGVVTSVSDPNAKVRVLDSYTRPSAAQEQSQPENSSSSSSSSSSRASSAKLNPTSNEQPRSRYPSPTLQSNVSTIDESQAETSIENATQRDYTRSNSSIKSVTINEVINATKEDNSDIEPDKCRAYARNTCIMR